MVSAKLASPIESDTYQHELCHNFPLSCNASSPLGHKIPITSLLVPLFLQSQSFHTCPVDVLSVFPCFIHLWFINLLVLVHCYRSHQLHLINNLFLSVCSQCFTCISFTWLKQPLCCCYSCSCLQYILPTCCPCVICRLLKQSAFD